MLAIFKHALLHIVVHLAKHSSPPAAGCNQAGGFVKALVEVLLQGQFRVKKTHCLADFSISKVGNDLTDELDDFQVVQLGQAPGGLRKQKVTGKDCDSGSVGAVDRCRACV